MAGLRDLIEKQKAEAAAKMVQKPSAPLSSLETSSKIPPPAVEAKRGFLARVKTAIPESSPPIPQQEVKKLPEPEQTEVSVPVVQTLVAPPPKADLSDAGIAELRRNLDFLANNIEQPALVGQVVRNIAQQLQDNPQFSSSMVNADFDLIVRGLRKAFNTAARKKSEGQAKRKASDEETSEFLSMLKDVGIGSLK